MCNSTRSEVITAKVTLQQKNDFIEKSKETGLPLSEWIANSLEYTLINEAAIGILEEELDTKDKLVNRLINQLENADLYIANLERRNINYKARVVGLHKKIDSINNANQNMAIDINAYRSKTIQTPIYAFGSLILLMSAALFANK
jgi:hypothetical protein